MDLIIKYRKVYTYVRGLLGGKKLGFTRFLENFLNFATKIVEKQFGDIMPLRIWGALCKVEFGDITVDGVDIAKLRTLCMLICSSRICKKNEIASLLEMGGDPESTGLKHATSVEFYQNNSITRR